MAGKKIFSDARHESAKRFIDMLLNQVENKIPRGSRKSGTPAAEPAEPPASSKNAINAFGICRLVCGGLIFIGLTVGIFWYQFARIPGSSRPELWDQLQWRYLFWLLLFLPIDTVAAGLRIWVISRVLQPGVSLWTCLKAEWVNLGLAMLTPSQTGGGFGQIYMLTRGGMALGTALTVSLISFLGSMVVLLFIGIHSLLLSKVETLALLLQGAILIFFLFFALMIVAVCWPASLNYFFKGLHRAIWKIGSRSRLQKGNGFWRQNRIKRITDLLHNLSQKLIDLCSLHQRNIHRFFNLNRFSFIWVCLLSLVFMLARAIMAFLCLRFLGIEASSLKDVLETQLNLIFLVYFAPTPGSSGLAEGASILMMDNIIPAGFTPFYNLLWRCTTLYLPAIAGLVFMSWTIIQDARRIVDR
jgi:uncharacterized protein (TIRG00374 family)